MQQGQVKAVLFDLGDTLITHSDSQANRDVTVAQRAVALLNQYGYGMTVSTFSDLYTSRWTQWKHAAAQSESEFCLEDFIRALLEDAGVVEAHLESITADLVAYVYETDLATVVPVDDAISTIQVLKQRGLRVGVVSNSAYSRNHIANILGTVGLLPYLDTIVVSSEIRKAKPSRKPFLRALDDISATPTESAFVGNDIAVDVIGALRAGFSLVFLLTHTKMDGELVLPPGVVPIVHLFDILDHERLGG